MVSYLSYTSPRKRLKINLCYIYIHILCFMAPFCIMNFSRCWYRLTCVSCQIMIQSKVTCTQKQHEKCSEQSALKEDTSVNFMLTPCINNIQHFNKQLTHTTLKNIELLKHFKISKTAPTCFGLQGNHHQGATIST